MPKNPRLFAPFIENKWIKMWRNQKNTKASHCASCYSSMSALTWLNPHRTWVTVFFFHLSLTFSAQPSSLSPMSQRPTLVQLGGGLRPHMHAWRSRDNENHTNERRRQTISHEQLDGSERDMWWIMLIWTNMDSSWSYPQRQRLKNPPNFFRIIATGLMLCFQETPICFSLKSHTPSAKRKRTCCECGLTIEGEKPQRRKKSKHDQARIMSASASMSNIPKRKFYFWKEKTIPEIHPEGVMWFSNSPFGWSVS